MIMLKKITFILLALTITQVIVADLISTAFGLEILNPNAACESYSSEHISPPLKLNIRNGCMTQIQIVKPEVERKPG